MIATDMINDLMAFPDRGAGTDAERRAATWLAGQLRAAGRPARIETFWCRPNWALANAWHAALGLAGSLLSVNSPRVGGSLILVALLAVIADGLLGVSPGRRLTRERASQNVISPGEPVRGTRERGEPTAAVRLVITANLDSGRAGLVYRPWMRRPVARLRGLTGALGPGWLGWLVLVLLWVEATAVARLVTGSHSVTIGLVQLVPTVILVLAVALLLEQGTAPFTVGAGDNASGVAAAMALARALAAGPPAHADVELLLQGAGDSSGLGLRRYLRTRRRTRRRADTIVIGIAACGAGTARWMVSEGQLVPVRHFKQLRDLAATVADQTPHVHAAPVRTRGGSPALPAAMARIPSLTIGALDDHGLVPRSHTERDLPEEVEQSALDQVVQLGLLLVDEIDGYLAERQAARQGERQSEPSATPA